MAEAVVGGALLRIAQDAIGLGGFLELLLGMLVAGIAVGMMRQGKLAVRGFQHRFVAVPDYTEDFIIVSFGHAHGLISLRLDGDLDHRRTQKATLEVIATLVFGKHSMVGRIFGLHHLHGVVDVRIKRLSLNNHRLQAEFLEGVEQALADQLQAVGIGFVRCLGL